MVRFQPLSCRQAIALPLPVPPADSSGGGGERSAVQAEERAESLAPAAVE